MTAASSGSTSKPVSTRSTRRRDTTRTPASSPPAPGPTGQREPALGPVRARRQRRGQPGRPARHRTPRPRALLEVRPLSAAGASSSSRSSRASGSPSAFASGRQAPDSTGSAGARRPPDRRAGTEVASSADMHDCESYSPTWPATPRRRPGPSMSPGGAADADRGRSRQPARQPPSRTERKRPRAGALSSALRPSARERQPYSEGRIWRSLVTRSSIGGWVENRPAMPFALNGLTM